MGMYKMFIKSTEGRKREDKRTLQRTTAIGSREL